MRPSDNEFMLNQVLLHLERAREHQIMANTYKSKFFDFIKLKSNEEKLKQTPINDYRFKGYDNLYDLITAYINDEESVTENYIELAYLIKDALNIKETHI